MNMEDIGYLFIYRINNVLLLDQGLLITFRKSIAVIFHDFLSQKFQEIVGFPNNFSLEFED